MTDTNIAPEAIEQRVALGPLNRWWPVAASWMVTDKPQVLLGSAKKLPSGAIRMVPFTVSKTDAPTRCTFVDGLEPRRPDCLLVSWRGNWRRRRREIGSRRV